LQALLELALCAARAASQFGYLLRPEQEDRYSDEDY
jgi:hypothetical protein